MKLPRLKSPRDIDFMGIRCSTYATFLIFGSVILLALAFLTPYWLVSENIPDQRFKRLGLWEACFVRLHDHYYRYDRVVSGCKYIFDDDYAFLINFLEPGK